MDLFDPDLYSGYLNSSIKLPPEDVYNCSASNEIRPSLHTCTHYTSCPLTGNLIEHAANFNRTWTAKHSLCKVRKTFHDPTATANVVFLGGSVTAGVSAKGCCCEPDLDTKCKSTSEIQVFYCDSKSHRAESYICRWHFYLYKWFKTKSMGNVNYVDFSGTGRSIIYYQEAFSREMKLHNIERFTANDIIFVDTSVNDALFFSMPVKQAERLAAIETLVRRIFLTYSTQPDETGKVGDAGWPTIIFLEHYVRAARNEDLGLTDYTADYRKIAAKYKLLVWSYKDVLNMDSFMQLSEKYPFINCANFGCTNDIHISWYVHLFYADMLGAILKREFHRCYSASTTDGMELEGFRSEEDIRDILNLKSEVKKTDFCNDSVPPLLEILSQDVYNNQNKFDGKYSSKPIGSWKIGQESKGRTGWIDKRQNPEHDEKDSLDPHFYSVLTFNLDSVPNSKYGVVKLEYLKTYENAGAVQVLVCDEDAGILDGLWRDFDEFHYSYPTFTSFTFSFAKCIENSNKGTVEIRHLTRVGIENENEYRENLALSTNYTARGDMKFKLISIKVCEMISTEH